MLNQFRLCVMLMPSDGQRFCRPHVVSIFQFAITFMFQHTPQAFKFKPLPHSLLAAMATAQQVVKIKDMVKAWQKPADWGYVTRRDYPFDYEPFPDPDLIFQFNAFMLAIPLAPVTRQKYETALMRFMMMFETNNGSPVDFPNLLLNIVRCELHQSLPELEIMTPEYSGSFIMSCALGHFAEMQKIRFAEEGNDLAMQMIDVIIELYLKPWNKSCLAAKTSSARRRVRAM